MNRTASPIAIGINARLFPINWRPMSQEITFARRLGCDCIQIHGREQGIDAAYLGMPLEAAGDLLIGNGVSAVMEIVVRVGANGRTASGTTPLEVLHNNLDAIRALAIRHVHWHFAPATRLPDADLRALEETLIDTLRAGVDVAHTYGFTLALEHNEPDVPLFAHIAAITRALEVAPELGFVWDLNHTPPDELDDWLDLAPRMTLLHVSDTPLPAVNYHLPLGQGSIDFDDRFCELRKRGYQGAAILEIGGVPKSGGFGRDTDEALCDSVARLRRAVCG
ncbi:sugar phosphate isomerase/epimerase family protein [Roseiflexus sp.]|uniref:sugar phosphate isomerase/epimerase family protein n=1 Tax=Roseiflexus sp. TaxID=2562120 RepID=UPI00398B47A0